MIDGIQRRLQRAGWTARDVKVVTLDVTGAPATPRLAADVEVSLTKREGEVLREMANGATNKQIAKIPDISCQAVKVHVRHILGKIGVSDRTQAAYWAIHKGLAEGRRSKRLP